MAAEEFLRIRDELSKLFGEYVSKASLNLRVLELNRKDAETRKQVETLAAKHIGTN